MGGGEAYLDSMLHKRLDATEVPHVDGNGEGIAAGFFDFARDGADCGLG